MKRFAVYFILGAFAFTLLQPHTKKIVDQVAEEFDLVEYRDQLDAKLCTFLFGNKEM